MDKEIITVHFERQMGDVVIGVLDTILVCSICPHERGSLDCKAALLKSDNRWQQ